MIDSMVGGQALWALQRTFWQQVAKPFGPGSWGAIRARRFFSKPSSVGPELLLGLGLGTFQIHSIRSASS